MKNAVWGAALPRRMPALALLSLLLLSVLAACAPQAAVDVDIHVNEAPAVDTARLALAPLDQMPAEVQEAPLTVQNAYRFAVANPEILKQVPCYCGCNAMGHTSNYSCYVAAVAGDRVSFDQHATGCGICIDITQDAMRMTAEGKSPQEIKTFVDQAYGRYGPGNMDG